MHGVDHVIRVVVPRVIVIANIILTLVPKPRTAMATGRGLVLPEPLHDEDLRFWFKQFEACAAAIRWDKVKKLLWLPTLLRGCTWAVFDSLTQIHLNT